MNTSLLTDSFGRKHRYLRISLTDKCNFRCTYCMPDESMKFMPSDKLMNANEIIEMVRIFREMGIEKVRLTGGEPTLRKDLIEIISGIIDLGIIPSITTNAALIHHFIDDFEKVGLKDVNVSIDSIQREKFNRITQRDLLDRVLHNIEELASRNFNLKLNVVLLRNFNEDEIVDLVNYGGSINTPVRFIEYMPFFGNSWEYEKVFTRKEILDTLSKEGVIKTLVSERDSTSTNYILESNQAEFGIISTVSNPFCQGCSRLRLTADGKMKNCLFSNDETDLLSVFRNGKNISDLIVENIDRKKKMAAGRIDFNDEKAAIDYSRNRSMVSIGG